MSDLEELRSMVAPRDEALCRRLSRRLESTFGFVMYGILWLWLGGSLALAPALGLMLAMSASMTPAQRAASPWLSLALLGGWLAGFIVVVWLFARWARGKRERAAGLFRDGAFADATPGELTRFNIKATQLTRATLSFDAGGTPGSATLTLPGHVESIGTVPVLFKHGCHYVAAFPLAGDLLPLRWRG